MDFCYSVSMETTTKHYRLLLGLDDSWDVVRVNLSLEEKRVEIFLAYVATGGTCPECGSDGPLADHAPERKWRHLDTMQFETILIAKTPRTQCPKCGVKTMTVPWADHFFDSNFWQNSYNAVQVRLQSTRRGCS